MSAEGEVLLPQDSYDGSSKDEADGTSPTRRKHHIEEEDDNNYNKSYPVQTDGHQPRGSPSIQQGLHPNPSPEMDRYPSMMSGQGSWCEYKYSVVCFVGFCDSKMLLVL